MTTMATVKPRPTEREPRAVRRRWRFYMTEAGRRPVDEFLDGVSEDDAARIAAAMKQVRRNGRADPDVNHLRGDIWQLEVDGERVIYRLLYAELGRSGQALLALEIVTKRVAEGQESPHRARRGAPRRLA